MNRNEECFPYQKMAVNDSFVQFTYGRSVASLDIFLSFVSNSLLQTIMDDFSESDLTLRRRVGGGTVSRVTPTISKIYQVIAIQIRIIGLHVVSQENNPGKKSLREAINLARVYFNDKVEGFSTPGLDYCECIISILSFCGDGFESILSQNFQNMGTNEVNSLLVMRNFSFTGISGDVRQVPSKPDGIGLWFYECCARLKCGKAFLLSFQMHHDMNGAIKVSDVVKQ